MTQHICVYTIYDTYQNCWNEPLEAQTAELAQFGGFPCTFATEQIPTL